MGEGTHLAVLTVLRVLDDEVAVLLLEPLAVVQLFHLVVRQDTVFSLRTPRRVGTQFWGVRELGLGPSLVVFVVEERALLEVVFPALFARGFFEFV